MILFGGGVYTVGGANLISFEDDEWAIKESITLEDGLAGEKVRHIYIPTQAYMSTSKVFIYLRRMTHIGLLYVVKLLNLIYFRINVTA